MERRELEARFDSIIHGIASNQDGAGDPLTVDRAKSFSLTAIALGLALVARAIDDHNSHETDDALQQIATELGGIGLALGSLAGRA